MYGMSNLDNNDKMINAAKIANIKDFIESLPNKYEEIIGEGETIYLEDKNKDFL